MKQNKKEEAMGVLGTIAEQDMTPKVFIIIAGIYC